MLPDTCGWITCCVEELVPDSFLPNVFVGRLRSVGNNDSSRVESKVIGSLEVDVPPTCSSVEVSPASLPCSVTRVSLTDGEGLTLLMCASCCGNDPRDDDTSGLAAPDKVSLEKPFDDDVTTPCMQDVATRFVAAVSGGAPQRTHSMRFPVGALPLASPPSPRGLRSGSSARLFLLVARWSDRVAVPCVCPPLLLSRPPLAIGSDCSAASALRFSGLKGPTMPLDWVRSSPVGLLSLLLRASAVESGSAVVQPFEEVSVLLHDEGTNRYRVAQPCDGEGTPSSAVGSNTSCSVDELPLAALVGDLRFDGFIATAEEALRAQRRWCRFLREWLWCEVPTANATPLLLLLHIARSCSAQDVYPVVIRDSTSNAQPTPMCAHVAALRDIARRLRRPLSVLVLLVINVCPSTFCVQVDNGVLLLHVSVGFGDPSTGDTVASVVSRLLRQLFVLGHTPPCDEHENHT